MRDGKKDFFSSTRSNGNSAFFAFPAKTILPAALLASLASCIELYEVEVPKQDNILIVESLLLDHPAYQYVNLYFQKSDGPRQTISDARVFVLNDKGQSWTFEEAFNGHYIAVGGVIPMATETGFQLQIEVGDSLSVKSSWEKVPAATFIDSAYLEAKYRSTINNNGIELTSKGIEVFVDTGPAESEQTYLRWTYEDTYAYSAPNASDLCSECKYCYISEAAENYNEISYLENSIGKRLTNHSIDFIEFDERFGIRFSVLVKQFTITKNAHEFYRTINQNKQGGGNIFDPPPAIAIGNLTNEFSPNQTIYGLFEVGRYSEAAARITRSNINYLIPSFSENCRGGTAGPDCFDCRNRDGASNFRPYYF